MKLERDERGVLQTFERGEWKSVRGLKRERARYARYAKSTLRKRRRDKTRD